MWPACLWLATGYTNKNYCCLLTVVAQELLYLFIVRQPTAQTCTVEPYLMHCRQHDLY